MKQSTLFILALAGHTTYGSKLRQEDTTTDETADDAWEDEYILEVIADYDADGDGKLSLDEYKTYWFDYGDEEEAGEPDEQMVQFVEEDFTATDTDQDGLICPDELKESWFGQGGEYDDWEELTDEEIATSMFEYYDENGDGMLVPSEFTDYDEEYVNEIFERHDHNKDGSLSPVEFGEHWNYVPEFTDDVEEMTEEELEEMFNELAAEIFADYDTEEVDGQLSRSEFSNFYFGGEGEDDYDDEFKEELIDDVFENYDANEDGMLSLEEFQEYWNNDDYGDYVDYGEDYGEDGDVEDGEDGDILPPKPT